MAGLKDVVRSALDPRIRDSIWALRTRGDGAVLAAVVRGMTGWRLAPGTVSDHLQATMTWLCAAQDAMPDGGVSAFYDVRAGSWCPAYPETTGYIIPTFFDYLARTSDDEFRKRAVRMADWLLTLQLPDGAFPIGPLWPEWERSPIVFDTGQIIQGLVRAAQETGRSDYTNAALRAGHWLADVQDADGCWRKFTPSSLVQTYNVRVAWAMLQLHEATGDTRCKGAAVRNLEWALTQQTPDGWFENASFEPSLDPLTHTIAYTIEGILESGILLGDEQLVNSARRAADQLRDCQRRDGYLRARYGPGWRSSTLWSCLTGDAQIAWIWFRFFERTGDDSYYRAGIAANDYVRRTQVRRSSLPGVRGGVAGSHSIYEGYEPYRNLNWAAKFFADSLLFEDRLSGR